MPVNEKIVGLILGLHQPLQFIRVVVVGFYFWKKYKLKQWVKNIYLKKDTVTKRFTLLHVKKKYIKIKCMFVAPMFSFYLQKYTQFQRATLKGILNLPFNHP